MRGGRGVVLVMALSAGCAPAGSGSAEQLYERALPETITVTSVAFEPGGEIPARFTCDGEGVTPPLAWSGVPERAVELALVVDDPDAPGGVYVHWVAFGIDPGVVGLGEGVVPGGVRQAVNSGGGIGYRGPCPPGGAEHTYRFSVYALGESLDLSDGAGTGEALAAVGEAAVAVGRLTGRYGRG